MIIIMNTVADLKVGQSLTIRAYQNIDAVILRLMEMGMSHGTLVTLLRKAPFGGPLEFSVKGTRLCLRRDQARKIMGELLQT